MPPLPLLSIHQSRATNSSGENRTFYSHGSIAWGLLASIASFSREKTEQPRGKAPPRPSDEPPGRIRPLAAPPPRAEKGVGFANGIDRRRSAGNVRQKRKKRELSSVSVVGRARRRRVSAVRCGGRQGCAHSSRKRNLFSARRRCPCIEGC
jgi:hypothetical protein